MAVLRRYLPGQNEHPEMLAEYPVCFLNFLFLAHTNFRCVDMCQKSKWIKFVFLLSNWLLRIVSAADSPCLQTRATREFAVNSVARRLGHYANVLANTVEIWFLFSEILDSGNRRRFRLCESESINILNINNESTLYRSCTKLMPIQCLRPRLYSVTVLIFVMADVRWHIRSLGIRLRQIQSADPPVNGSALHKTVCMF